MASFCLVHGAWHDASCWDEVVPALVAHGHVVAAPNLPFHDPAAGGQERIAPALESISAVEGPIVVVGHSMGAGYAPLIAATRPGSLVVHLCPGLGRLREGFPWPPMRSDGTCAWDQAGAIAAMYPRLAPAVAESLARRLRPMAPERDPRRATAGVDGPCVVVVAADDELFDPVSERSKAAERLGVDVIEIPGGHFPMVEDPGHLMGLLERLAAEHEL